MMRKKVAVWSTHRPNRFAFAVSDLRVYEVKTDGGMKWASVDSKASQSTDEGRTIRLVGIQSEIHDARCLAWCPRQGGETQENATPSGPSTNSADTGSTLSAPSNFMKGMEMDNSLIDREDLIAAGLMNGKVVLCSFGNNPGIIKEFVPQQARQCNAVAWNENDISQLACGLDKIRNDFCLLVWNLTRSGMITKNPTASMSSIESVATPQVALANQEGTLSVAWVPTMINCLAAGTGSKWLRIYDLRDRGPPKSIVAHVKGVMGIKFDPFRSDRMLSFSDDGYIKIWDLRNFGQPLFTINASQKGVTQVEWSPTVPGQLAALAKDDGSALIYKLRDTEPDVLNLFPDHSLISLDRPTRTLYASVSGALSSISWNSVHPNCLLAATASGVAKVVTLKEYKAFNLSPQSDLVVVNGDTFVEGSLGDSRDADFDISIAMKERAVNGYSFDINRNHKLASRYFPKPLKMLWEWMKRIQSLSPQYQGIYDILHSKDGSVFADSVAEEKEKEREREREKAIQKIYASAQRSFALRICGWGFDPKSNALDEKIHALDQENKTAQAAALAVFHLDIKKAIQTLNRNAGRQVGDKQKMEMTNAKLMSMALAGYNEKETGLWAETCSNMANQLEEPYLRASFRFLCSKDDSYAVVVNDEELHLWDRIAFALKFLPDAKLISFIDKLTNDVVSSGNLEGIIMTGLSPRGVDLLQNYVNNTGDVQTATLIITHATLQDRRAEKWLYCYRELLDAWGLWHQRCILDIAIGGARPHPPQVYTRCTFCNKAISLGSAQTQKGGRYGQGGASQAKEKISACPTCNKSLPKCCVCLLPLNCSIVVHREDVETTAPMPFEEWFTWCQTCRHGGHSSHILEWFETHSECPVSDCICNCSSL